MKSNDFWLGMIFFALSLGNCQSMLNRESLTTAIRAAPTCECRCAP